MQVFVALGARAKIGALLNGLVQAACQSGGCKPDPRNLRTWRQLVLGVLVKRSTRLLTVAQVAVGQRRTHSVKAAAMALGYFLNEAKVAMRPFSTQLLEAAVRQLDWERLATYRGKALLVIDPTEYEKRSRGRGKRGRQMQYIGRVRRSKGQSKGNRKKTGKKKRTGATEKVATTFGYVDVWAGLVLKGKQFLPLARHLFSSNHPKINSQNKVEEGVLYRALGMLTRVGLMAIVVADRGLGRKELITQLVSRGYDLVMRIDSDITVILDGMPGGVLLREVLADLPWLGEVVWNRGEGGKLRCQARTVRATIRFSRSGRKNDYEQATLNFLELVPIDSSLESLLVATTLPLEELADAKGIARVYAQSWAVESGFEMMHAWGQDRFMVRHWKAIDRLLWVVALAYTLMVLALQLTKLARFREQAIAVLKRLSVVGRRLTAGKLAEAIGLDFDRHRRAWASAWFT